MSPGFTCLLHRTRKFEDRDLTLERFLAWFFQTYAPIMAFAEFLLLYHGPLLVISSPSDKLRAWHFIRLEPLLATSCFLRFFSMISQKLVVGDKTHESFYLHYAVFIVRGDILVFSSRTTSPKDEAEEKEHPLPHLPKK